ncbi:MAG: hypothetical protein R2838_02865 [Caldilineaceae bacterium]
MILAWAINAVWTRWGGVLAPRTMDHGRDGCAAGRGRVDGRTGHP